MSGALGMILHKRGSSGRAILILFLVGTGLIAWKLIGAQVLGAPPRLRSELSSPAPGSDAGLAVVVVSPQDSARAVSAAALLRKAGGPLPEVMSLRSPGDHGMRRLLNSLGHAPPVLLTVDAERRIVQIQSLTVP